MRVETANFYVNKRYEYGERRLIRLDFIYCLTGRGLTYHCTLQDLSRTVSLPLRNSVRVCGDYLDDYASSRDYSLNSKNGGDGLLSFSRGSTDICLSLHWLWFSCSCSHTIFSDTDRTS